MVDLADSFRGFLYSSGTEVRRLEEIQRKCTDTAVMMDLGAIQAFLRIVDSKLSKLGWFSYCF